MADYKWKPIEDLPDDWTKLASSELGGLAAVWVEHYETIKDSKALKQFNERLRREWAIETGIIENLYYIDRGVTLTLIEKGIEASLIPHGSTDRSAELIVPMLKDHEEVVTGLFDFVGQQRQLSTSYIKQLHQALTEHQRTTAAKDNFGTMMEVELLRGEWKKLPNNPTKSDDSVHEYCPPEQVASEIDRLISLHQEHLVKGIPPEVEAAWLHHRFTQIHPFQDGNGRMARTLASLIFLRAGLFPLVIHRDERDEYIDALEKSDKQDLKSLIQFFSQAQKGAINKALDLSESVLLKGNTYDQIIDSAITKILTKKPTSAIGKIHLVEKIAGEKIKALITQINPKLSKINPKYRAYHEVSTKSSKSLFSKEVAEIAKNLSYEANSAAYSEWQELLIDIDDITEIILSFHGWGKKKLGIISVSAFMIRSTLDPQKNNERGQPLLLCKSPFQFTLNEDVAIITQRFEGWLDEVMMNGLVQWQQRI